MNIKEQKTLLYQLTIFCIAQDTPVMDTFENLYKKLQEIRKPFTIIYGMVWATDRHSLASGDQEPEEEDLLNEDPLLVLFEYARLQNFRLVDMFKQLDMDNSGSLDREEFSRGLAVSYLKLDGVLTIISLLIL